MGKPTMPSAGRESAVQNQEKTVQNRGKASENLGKKGSSKAIWNLSFSAATKEKKFLMWAMLWFV